MQRGKGQDGGEATPPSHRQHRWALKAHHRGGGAGAGIQEEWPKHRPVSSQEGWTQRLCEARAAQGSSWRGPRRDPCPLLTLPLGSLRGPPPEEGPPPHLGSHTVGPLRPPSKAAHLLPFGASEGTGQLAKGPPSACGLSHLSMGHTQTQEERTGDTSKARGHCLGGLIEETSISEPPHPSSSPPGRGSEA